MRNADLTKCRWAVLALVAWAATGCHRPDPAVVRVIEQNEAARGGLERWRKVQSMSLTGTLEAGPARDPVKVSRDWMGTPQSRKAEARRVLLHDKDAAPKQVSLPFVMELQRPRRTRLEVRFQGQTAVQVFDGARGWKLRPFLGRHEVEPFTPAEQRLALQQADLDGPLIDAIAKGHQVELLGTEAVEGHDAYKLRVTSEDGLLRQVWVDAKTFLDLKVDGTRWMDGKPRAVMTYFRDYRPVEGLLVPHLLETRVEGVATPEKIVIEQVKVDAPIAVARFSKPE